MKKQQEELEESKRADSKTSKVKGVISKDKSKSMASTSKASTSKACKETSSPLPAAHLFKGYNLKDLGVPRCAWPDESKVHHGKHGYTVTGSNDAVLWPLLRKSFALF